MTHPDPAEPSPRFACLNRPAQWAITLALSIVFTVALELLGLPAALLLGPMAAAILVAGIGGALSVPREPFHLAQAIVGLMIARSIPPSILGEIAKDGPIFIGGIVSTIIASNALGYWLARRQVLPGTTAIWGSSPGAASVMTFMAEAYGADVRLVAVMQYLRVVLVAVSASIVALIFVAPGGHAASVDWFPPVDGWSLVATLAVAAAGATLGRRLRLPAGPLLLPLALGIALQGFGVLHIELPPWLLAASYALIGWSIGLRFTRPIIAHAARALPILIASVMILIGLCGLFAWALVHFAGLDPLTAFLATSPGGADTVAIIAASAQVDLQFVMTMQTARLIIVLLTGPSIARFIAGRIERRRTP